MSIKIVSFIFECEVLSDQSETLVMLALADWADDEGICYPSVPKLAKKARLSERGTRYVLKRLRKKGLVDWDENRGRGQANRYYINLKNLQNLQPVQVNRPIDGSVGKPAKPANDDIKPANDDTKTCNSFAPEPSLEPSRNRQSARDARARGSRQVDRSNPSIGSNGKGKPRDGPAPTGKRSPPPPPSYPTPESVVLDEELLAYCAERAPDINPHDFLDTFKNRCLAKRYGYANYRRAFQSWIKDEQARVDQRRANSAQKAPADRRSAQERRSQLTIDEVDRSTEEAKRILRRFRGLDG